MKEYCADDKSCRHSLLLAYFGERFTAGRCGNRCDNCAGPCAKSADLWQVVGENSHTSVQQCSCSSITAMLYPTP